MKHLIVILPIVIPMVTAALCLLTWKWKNVQKVFALLGSAIILITALNILYRVRSHGILVEQMGTWASPYGITLVADLFSSIMLVSSGIVGVIIVVYSFGCMGRRRESCGHYPLMMVLLMGVNGSFLTGDLFNLYVWFEVMLMASFVLLAHGGEKLQLEGCIKYIVINLLSSVFFLTGLGILYATVGTLNMADIASKLSTLDEAGFTTVIAMLFFVAFGIKAGVFPLFSWLPASYHTPPVATSALFAGLLTKVGVYALIRMFTLIFTADNSFIMPFLLVIAGFTMITGVLGAVSRNDIRKILAFHIVSQIGYMIMGLALLTPLAIAGTIFFIVHNIVVKTNLFLVAGIVNRLKGTYELKWLGDIYKTYPLLGVLFLIPALSIAGVPPLSGFFGKLFILMASLKIGTTSSYIMAAIMLVVSVLTFYSMTKIWTKAFWKKAPAEADIDQVVTFEKNMTGVVYMVIPTVCLAALAIVMGVGSNYFFELTWETANQLLDKSQYIHNVLGHASSNVAVTF
ncbi:MAG: Na+/H+ antiporter subunit D [Bacteriovoracaceae bacterium]|nr:Na+/H+ antiporter subunit D [Bacteriovoracaceae bacterium]